MMKGILELRRRYELKKIQIKIQNEKDNKINIELEIVLAKSGKKEAFNSLWRLYKPIIIRNVDRFCMLAKGFEQYRPSMIYDSYVSFWDIINDYDFNSDIPFSYYVNDQLLEKTKQKIKGNRHLPLELIDDEKLRSNPGYRNTKNRERLNDLRIVMKNLTPKQLQAVYLYHYRGLTQLQSSKIVGISQPVLGKRLMFAHNKIKKSKKKLIWSRLSKKEKSVIIKMRKAAKKREKNVIKKI